MKPIYLIFTASLIGIGAFFALNVGDSQKTVPKIKLSYFVDMNEFSSAINQRLQQELSKENIIFFGVEPEKKEHLHLAIQFKNDLEKNKGLFDAVWVDQELELQASDLMDLGTYENVLMKENWFEIAENISNLKDKKIFVLTASIYSTNLLKQNPLSKIKTKAKIQPMTFSVGYFSIDTPKEARSLFPCSTENKEGVSEWGCAMVNKSRTQRRKYDSTKNKISGLMDLTGEKDYMILIYSPSSESEKSK